MVLSIVLSAMLSIVLSAIKRVVMSFEIKLEQFSGPLDLLLALIEQEKLDISQVSLAQVTDAYLQRLAADPNLPPEEMADFLVIASRLLLIKSRVLLPFISPGEEEPDDLETQLKIYKEYLEASKTITALIGKRRFLFVHEKLPPVDVGFAPPKKLTAVQMAAMFEAVIRRLDVIIKVPSAVVERVVSIHEKIKEIQEMIVRASRLTFRSLLDTAQSRVEIIVSFLALLELIKQRTVAVTQERQFDEITVIRVETTETVSA